MPDNQSTPDIIERTRLYRIWQDAYEIALARAGLTVEIANRCMLEHFVQQMREQGRSEEAIHFVCGNWPERNDG